VVKPSFIRVEADEVSYGLHVIARFEIEKDLIGGKIKVGDLPKIWNAKYQELLGITPPDDRFGVLQDIHWSHGAFGYFPTYLLGSLMAAQLMTTAQKQIDIYNLPVLREWLRDNIHRHGRIYTSKELLLQVTGEDLNPKYYIDYLESKFRQLYP
jgi:carboxypeptidase Taq